MRRLTAKQTKFVHEYLSNGGNAAKAYRAAYDTKASPAITSVEGHKLLKDPRIALLVANANAKVAENLAKAEGRYVITRERNLQELARMAYANMQDYTKVVGGELIPDMAKASRDELVAVQEIIVEDFVDGRGDDARDVRKVRLKLVDKGAAIERINRMMGWNIDRSETKVVDKFSNMTADQLRDFLLDKGVRGVGEDDPPKAGIGGNGTTRH